MKSQLPKNAPSGKKTSRKPRYLISLLLMGSLATLLLSGCSRSATSMVGNYQNSDPVGSSEVNISVDASGSAVIQLPIQLPPGTNGLQPQLTLLYNSVLGNGDMGVGWNIQGLSTIERTGATMAQDGFISSVNYNGNDRLSLDGQRLIQVSGSAYGLTNSQYHTEIESWRKVNCNANMASSTSSFTVYSPNGLTQSYGATNDSRIYAQGKTIPRVWALNRVEDLHGNYMTISYINNGNTTGSYYPSEIQYTGNSKTPASTKRSVQFVWENRTDAPTAYMGGSGITENKRLQYVKTYVNNTLIKEYKIEYAYSSTTSRSLVQKIIEKDAQGTAYPATTFSWQQGANQFQTDYNWGSKKNSVGGDGTLQWMVDMNGDGTADHVYNKATSNEYWVMLGSGNGTFATDTNWGSKINDIANKGNAQWLVDVNGDGMADLVYNKADSKEYRVMLSTGSGFGTDSHWGSRAHDDVGGHGTLQWLVDMNGDGTADHVYNEAGTHDYWVMLSTTGGFASDVKWGTRSNYDIGGKGNAQWLADVNGDGMADLVYNQANSNEYRVMLSTGNLFATDTKWGSKKNSIANKGDLQWLLDMNGDGMADHIYQRGDGTSANKNEYWVMLSTGSGFASDAKWGSRSNDDIGGHGTLQWLADMNGDGTADHVYNKAGSHDYRVMLNTGSGFATDASWGTRLNYDVGGHGNAQWLADVNGDGMADLVYNKATSLDYCVMLSKGPVPDLLTNVVNGAGGETALAYNYLASGNVYQQGGTGNYPTADAPGYIYGTGNQALYISDVNGGSRYVVQNMTLSNNSTDNKQDYNYKYDYYYGGAKIDHTGRGWLGFAFKETIDEQMGTKQVEQFNQVFPFTGTASLTNVYCFSNNGLNCLDNPVLHQKRTEYYCLDGKCSTNDQQNFINTYNAGGTINTVYQVLTYKDIDTYYTYGTFNYAIGNTYRYDTYGNPTQRSYLGYLDTKGNDVSEHDNVYYTYEYYNNTKSSYWLIGFNTQQTVSSDEVGNDVLSKALKGYNFPAATEGEPCIKNWQYTGTMDVICESGWVNQDNNGGANYWITQQTRYDSYGNQTLSIGTANDSTLIAYETTYNTFPKQKTLPPNQQGIKMAETYTYDAGFGVKTATTDVNGNTTTNVLDGFGRVVARTGPNAQNPQGPTVTLEKINYYKNNGVQYFTTKSLRGWDSNTYHPVNQYYDGLQRTYRKESVSGQPAENIIVDYQFVDPQRLSQESLPYFNNGEDPIYWNTRTYDAYGRIIQLKEPYPDASGNKQIVTDIAYPKNDSIVRTTHDPLSAATDVEVQVQQWYNGEQQTAKLIFPQNMNATTRYQYDRLGRVTYVKDADKVENTTTWNSLSAKLQFTETNMGATSYRYNNTGQLKTVTDAKNQTQEFTYDLLNRTIAQTLKDANGTVVKTITFTFDESLPGTSNTQGKLSTVTVQKGNSEESAYTYGYSSYGHLTMEQLTFDRLDYITRMAYSPAGSQTQYTYPDNSVLNIQRGNNGNLGSLSLKNYNTNDSITVQYSKYDALGKVGQLTYGNGTVTAYQYMKDGLLDNVKLTKGSNTLMQHSFSWNYLKELQKLTDNNPDTINYTQSFTHTSHRLTKAVGAYGTLTYGYSMGGNMTTIEGSNYSYTGHQIISSDAGFLADYDANGNMTFKKTDDGGSYNYEYDTQNRLTAVYKNDSKTAEETYVYDYQGRRLLKTDTGSGTVTYVTKGYEIAQQGGSTTSTKYVLGPGGHIGSMAVSDKQPVTIRYYHHDQINSTNMATDNQGNIISLLVYKPYGELYTTLSYGEDNVRFKYGDKELDATGLYYFNARYYDPGIGRFITADTRLGSVLFTQDAFNRYAYALNDPIDYIDPSGHLSKRGQAGIALAVSTAITVVGVAVAPSSPILGAILIGAGISGMTDALIGLGTGDFNVRLWVAASVVGGIVGWATGLPGGVVELSEWGWCKLWCMFGQDFLGTTGRSEVTTEMGAGIVVLNASAESTPEGLSIGVMSKGLTVPVISQVIYGVLGKDLIASPSPNSGTDAAPPDPNADSPSGGGTGGENEQKQKAAFENEVGLPGPGKN